MIRVKKRSGKLEDVDLSKIERVLVWGSEGLSIDYRDLFNENNYKEFVYNEIPTSTIQELLANQAATKIEENSDWDALASRIVLQKIRKEAHQGEVDYCSFSEYLENVNTKSDKKVNEGLGYIFDLDQIDKAIVPERDLLFAHMGIVILKDRYLLKDTSGDVIEAPQHFFMRVAMGLALKDQNPTQSAIETYEVYSKQEFLSSTPTLFNSATTHPQLSSCFISIIKDDSLEGIFDTHKEIANCSKFSGGTALSYTPLRSAGSLVRSTGGESSGVVPYIKMGEQTVRSFDQGGKRPGVLAAYLEVWHKDIFDFLRSADPSVDERIGIRDINLATWINDLFMQRVDDDGDWTLLCPSDCPDLHDLWGEAFETAYLSYEATLPEEKKVVVKAREVFAVIMKCLFNNKGNGWPCFKDTINKRSMTRGYGVVHSSNLCTEITIRNSSDRTSVCNLGSINLAKIKTKEQLENVVRVGVRAIDNAVENGFVPIESGNLLNQEDRPLGLGVMGYTEFLSDQGIPFESYDHLYAANILFEFISYIAIDESSRLGREKGNFPMFEYSQWAKGELPMDTGFNKYVDEVFKENEPSEKFTGNALFESMLGSVDWEGLRLRSSKNMRNSLLLAIAPNATISNILGTTPCIELPMYNVYQKENKSGDFTCISPLYRKHKDNPELCKTAKGKTAASHYWQLMANAVRQIWVDQAQSFNVWVEGDITSKALADIYRTGWRIGNKTFYYLRSDSPDSERDEKVNDESVDEPIEDAVPFCDMSEGCESCQ